MSKKMNSKAVMKVERVAGNGSVADTVTPAQQLKRCVMASLLWENLAYETGMSNAETMMDLVPRCEAAVVQAIAIHAATKQKIRHTPLLLIREMCKYPEHRKLVAQTLVEVVNRPDQITDFVSLYWQDGKKPLPNQVKRGLNTCFKKFNEYSLAKFNSSTNAVKLRDVMFLTHPRPDNDAQKELFKKLANNELATPETWEVLLSAGNDKKATWEKLLSEKKLPPMALIRNLRNMVSVDVNDQLIRSALLSANAEKMLPFQFLTAVRHAPKYRNELQTLMFSCLRNMDKLKGKTAVIVDLSGSMGAGMGGKSELNRMDAAIALTMLIKEVSEDCVVYATAGSDGARKHKTEKVQDGNGFDLMDTIHGMTGRMGGGGIFLKQCCDYVAAHEKDIDTLIVVSDSQDTSGDESPKLVQPSGKSNYMMDISCHKNGIGYNKFIVLNGFSEHLVDYVVAQQNQE